MSKKKKRQRQLIIRVLIVLVVIASIGNIIFIKKQRDKWEEEQKAQEEQLQEEQEDIQDEPVEKPEEDVQEEPVVETEPEEEEEVQEPEKPEESEEPQEPEVEEPEEPEPEPETPSVPKVEAIPGQYRDPNNIIVVLDPGHQRSGDSTKEPNGPGSGDMKARVTGGATGVSTGVTEYVLNLDVSLKLKTELENRGYVVYMTRDSHGVNISNMERAQYASEVGADIAVRIHGNSVDSASVSGAETLVPSSGNAYVSHLANASYSLGQNIIDEYCRATGFKNRGVKANDTMTGINWSEVPVAIIELGFMSNPEEDQAMQDATMQNNMVQGIANGIDRYFGL